MARDRPPPYGDENPFLARSAGALACHTRMREGFPRDRSICAKTARHGRFRARGMAKDRFSHRPTVPAARCFHRRAGAVTATVSDL